MAYSEYAAGVMSSLGDRRVAYSPDLARLIGVKETVFLMQLLYWDGKGKLQGGWIWKTQKEFEEETGLSRCEQETSRKNLKKLGVLDEKLAQIPAKLHYRIDFTALGKIVDDGYPRRRGKDAETQDSGNPPNKIAETPQSITEITPEITSYDITLPTEAVSTPVHKEISLAEPAPVKEKPKRKQNRRAKSGRVSEHQRYFSALSAALRIPRDMTGDQRGRLNSFTKRIRTNGFDLAHIKAAEREWWNRWPGNTGSPPNDGQFLQRLEIVRRRKADHDRQWT